MNRIVKQKINQVAIILIIVIAFAVAISLMLKYKIEGETNMPFTIKRMIIVSGAESESKAENPENYKWNLNVNQYNDIYIEFQKNENYKNIEYIDSITLENFKTTTPQKGTVEIYMPNTSEERLFVYSDNLKVKNSLTYKGSSDNNYKTLTIANQGGTILFRTVNRNISEYISNDDEEIKYDGTLLPKTNVNLEETKFNLTFDIVIKIKNNKFRATVSKDLPFGDIATEGVTQEITTNFDNLIFKREK